MIPNLYRGHPSTSIPFKITYPCRPPELACFLLLYKSNFHTIMVIILSILMVILLSYLISDLHMSSTYYYRYTAILSFRGLILIALQCLYVARKGEGTKAMDIKKGLRITRLCNLLYKKSRKICTTANTSFAASRYIACMRIQWRYSKVCCAKKHPVQCNILKYLGRTKESAIKQAFCYLAILWERLGNLWEQLANLWERLGYLWE